MKIININNLCRFYEINSGKPQSLWAYRNFAEKCSECQKVLKRLNLRREYTTVCSHTKQASENTLVRVRAAMNVLDSINPQYTVQLVSQGFLWLSQAAQVCIALGERGRYEERDTINFIMTKLGKYDQENLELLGCDNDDIIALTEFFNQPL